MSGRGAPVSAASASSSQARPKLGNLSPRIKAFGPCDCPCMRADAVDDRSAVGYGRLRLKQQPGPSEPRLARMRVQLAVAPSGTGRSQPIRTAPSQSNGAASGTPLRWRGSWLTRLDHRTGRQAGHDRGIQSRTLRQGLRVVASQCRVIELDFRRSGPAGYATSIKRAPRSKGCSTKRSGGQRRTRPVQSAEGNSTRALPRRRHDFDLHALYGRFVRDRLGCRGPSKPPDETRVGSAAAISLTCSRVNAPDEKTRAAFAATSVETVTNLPGDTRTRFTFGPRARPSSVQGCPPSAAATGQSLAAKLDHPERSRRP